LLEGAWGRVISQRPHPVKGYIMYSTISGIVYPFTGAQWRISQGCSKEIYNVQYNIRHSISLYRGGPHPVKGYIMYSTISGIVYPFTGVAACGTVKVRLLVHHLGEEMVDLRGERAGVMHHFDAGCLPLSYSSNPGVNGVSYRGGMGN
jgi:hypothetical protein